MLTTRCLTASTEPAKARLATNPRLSLCCQHFTILLWWISVKLTEMKTSSGAILQCTHGRRGSCRSTTSWDPGSKEIVQVVQEANFSFIAPGITKFT